MGILVLQKALEIRILFIFSKGLGIFFSIWGQILRIGDFQTPTMVPPPKQVDLYILKTISDGKKITLCKNAQGKETIYIMQQKSMI